MCAVAVGDRVGHRIDRRLAGCQRIEHVTGRIDDPGARQPAERQARAKGRGGRDHVKGRLVAGIDVGVVGNHVEHHGTVRALIAQIADLLQIVRRPGRSREADIRLVAADGRGDVDGPAADNDAVIGEREYVGRGIPVDRDR